MLSLGSVRWDQLSKALIVGSKVRGGAGYINNFFISDAISDNFIGGKLLYILAATCCFGVHTVGSGIDTANRRRCDSIEVNFNFLLCPFKNKLKSNSKTPKIDFGVTRIEVLPKYRSENSSPLLQAGVN